MKLEDIKCKSYLDYFLISVFDLDCKREHSNFHLLNADSI